MHMSSIVLFLTLLLFADPTKSWEYCKPEIKSKICANKGTSHIVCDSLAAIPETTHKSETFLAHVPLTRKVKEAFLNWHNYFRHRIAGGKGKNFENSKKFPMASRMRELIWDKELSFIAHHRTQLVVMGSDTCHATQRFLNAGLNMAVQVMNENKPVMEIIALAVREWYDGKDAVNDPENMGKESETGFQGTETSTPEPGKTDDAVSTTIKPENRVEAKSDSTPIPETQPAGDTASTTSKSEPENSKKVSTDLTTMPGTDPTGDAESTTLKSESSGEDSTNLTTIPETDATVQPGDEAPTTLTSQAEAGEETTNEEDKVDETATTVEPTSEEAMLKKFQPDDEEPRSEADASTTNPETPSEGGGEAGGEGGGEGGSEGPGGSEGDTSTVDPQKTEGVGETSTTTGETADSSTPSETADSSTPSETTDSATSSETQAGTDKPAAGEESSSEIVTPSFKAGGEAPTTQVTPAEKTDAPNEAEKDPKKEPEKEPESGVKGSAKQFMYMVSDRTSRIGCAIALGSNCKDKDSTTYTLCYYVACAYDFDDTGLIYKTTTSGPAGECSRWGVGISKLFKNLCENSGEIFDYTKET